MAQEFTQSSFFDHSTYSNVYYAAQIPLEFYLADVLMRSDLTRVQWSSDEYAFRRRFELADSQNGGDLGNFQATNLRLPFVNYWYQNGKFWEPDDRPFSINSQQILKGQWEEGMPARLYAIAVKTPLIATAYYSTDQDARLAYELLMWERQPKGPIQLTSNVSWKGVDIQIPTFITIDDVNFNPKFTEVEWLKVQRMFPMQLRMTLRTYIIYYPTQPSLSPDLLNSNRPMPPYSTGKRPGGDENVYITEQVLLNFAALKQWGTFDTSTDFLVQGTEATDYAQQIPTVDNVDGLDTVQYSTDAVNDTTIDIVTGYFSPTSDILINACFVDPSTITTSSFLLSWDVNQTSLESFKDVTIMVPGQAPIQITDPRVAQTTISGLYPNSEYSITVLFHSETGGVRDFHLTVTTASDATTVVPLKRRKGKLKGMEW